MELDMMLKTGIGISVFGLFCLAAWLFRKKGAV